MSAPCPCPLCGADAVLPLTILQDRALVVSGGRVAALTGKEALLLAALASSFPRMVRKERLLDAVSGFCDDAPELKIIDVWVCKIRKKTAGMGFRIDTIWGEGYALAADAAPVIVREAAE